MGRNLTPLLAVPIVIVIALQGAVSIISSLSGEELLQYAQTYQLKDLNVDLESARQTIVEIAAPAPAIFDDGANKVTVICDDACHGRVMGYLFDNSCVELTAGACDRLRRKS